MAKGAAAAFGVEAGAVESVDEAAAADIVATATTSTSPMLNLANIAPGTHINAIGSNTPARKEIDPALLKVSKLVVDLKDQAVQESGRSGAAAQGRPPVRCHLRRAR